jgi:hypothetical protein
MSTRRSSGRQPLHKALLGSFAIYLVPLFGPHAAWLLGEYLYAELTYLRLRRPAGWVALDFGAALTAQAVAVLLLSSLFARPRPLRFVVLVASLPISFAWLHWACLLAIPRYFLVEADVSPERSEWPVECFLPDASLARVRTPPGLSLERARRAWVTAADQRSYALLASCHRVLPVFSRDAGPTYALPFVLADGHALFATWDKQAARARWWVFPGAAGAASPLEPPPDSGRGIPILSHDGEWTAWIEQAPAVRDTPRPERVRIRSVHDTREQVVPLPPPPGPSFVLLGVDVAAGSLTLFEYDTRALRAALVVFDLGGARVARIEAPPTVAPQSTTMLCAGDGCAAWDAYRDEGRYRLAWALGRGTGSHEVALGRGITSVDLDPSGSYVALSTTTNLSIGRIRDSVYVLRVRDGVEVFRRYLPTYSRSQVAFLGAGRFAYDDWDGSRFGVRIVRISAPEAAP